MICLYINTGVGFWLALEDCTTENGCLSFVKNSHKDNLSNKRMIRQGHTVDTINNITLTQHSNINVTTTPNNTDVNSIFIGNDKSNYTASQYTVEPVKRGSLVLIHGDVVHSSTANTSSNSRYIYTFHCIDGYKTTYPNTNWLQSKLPFPHLLTVQEEQQQLDKIIQQQDETKERK